ncbi:MAG: hypothetical protein QHC79_17570 [Pseudosphingobacterium sp.]|nr:hypothetical protein [Olivibacter sp. UJ_SKK_5.1]MDX3915357.1 hypothetical protein [Pseudosphingobacterium sp.]
MEDHLFNNLKEFVAKIPSIKVFSAGFYEEGLWWMKFKIDIDHPLAWRVVQELACIVNYLSINERLPTKFYPVSPAPYLNGGPDDFLSWIIENTDKDFTPDLLAKWLEGRLPQPVEAKEEWEL